LQHVRVDRHILPHLFNGGGAAALLGLLHLALVDLEQLPRRTLDGVEPGERGERKVSP